MFVTGWRSVPDEISFLLNAVTFPRRRCCPSMSAASSGPFSIPIALPFVANTLQLVANAFPPEHVAFLTRLVRSYQLCCVAGSLWGRPHFSVRETGIRPLA